MNVQFWSKATKIFVSSIIILFVFLWLTLGCNLRTKNERYEENFSDIPHELGSFTRMNTSVRYLITGDTTKNERVWIFIHGAPGSMEQWKDYHLDSSLLETGVIVSYDRPGYGYSDLGDAMPDFQQQVECVDPLLKRFFNHKYVTVIGHSYGGPIAALIAARYPDQVDEIVLIAPAIDPEEEKYVKLAKVFRNSPLWNLSGEAMKVATIEKLRHQRELNQLEDNWYRITSKVTYVHGEKDRIVPFENIDFIEKKIAKTQLETIIFPTSGHFIPFSESGQVIELLLR